MKPNMNHSEEFENLAATMALGALNAEDIATLSALMKSGGAEWAKTMAESRRVHRALAVTPEKFAEPPLSVKSRLMESLKNPDASTRHTEFAFVKETDGDWQILAPGVYFKSLFNNPATGSSTMLVRMAAGATIPAHHHNHIEELYVLKGDCYCARDCLHAGDYHRAAGGSTHGATFTEDGCFMIVHTSSSAAKP